MSLTSELSLDAVLGRLIQTAAELTGAKYAALGVIDASHTKLERFVTHGVEESTHAMIGSLPTGRGILGLLINDARPIRLHDLTEDPHSVGFPAHHPEMRSFLGVPVMLRGTNYGNLYLSEKEDGSDFSEEDQELVTLLAGQAAIAIENARLYEASTRWSRRLETLNEVGNALATETDIALLLDLIVRRLRELLSAKLVTLSLPHGADEIRIAAAAGEGSEGLIGNVHLLDETKSGRVFQRRRSERVDSLVDDPEVTVEGTRRLGLHAGIWVPMIAHDRTIGIISAADKLTAVDHRFSDDDLRLAETFASRAATAVDISERVARDILRRVVDAQETERRRLARELHDETGQALTSILLGLKSLEETVATSPEAELAVAGLRELVVATLQDVRRLAVELRPKALDDFGLVAALERLTDTYSGQTGITVDFEAALPDDRFPPEIETTLYRMVQEALTNVVKHARARRVSILLTQRPNSVAAVIEDDGTGFDPTEPGDGFGLTAMRERVNMVGGTLTIETGQGTGTTIVVEVPIR